MSSHRYSPGQVAGAAVGSALGAALITLLFAALLWRFCGGRRSKHRSRRSSGRSRSEIVSTTSSRRGAVPADAKFAATGKTYAWEAYLPQSADDGTIRQSVKKFYSQVELHVDNYYSRADVELDDNNIQCLAEVNPDKLPGPIYELLTSRSMTIPTIKHCIARLLITMATPGQGDTLSLLPARVAVSPTRLRDNPQSSHESLGKLGIHARHHRSALTIIHKLFSKPFLASRP